MFILIFAKEKKICVVFHNILKTNLKKKNFLMIPCQTWRQYGDGDILLTIIIIEIVFLKRFSSSPVKT